MALYIEVDISEVTRELDRLIAEPGTPTVLGLEGVLASTFAATQLTVPVDTGSLRGSGAISSAVAPAFWEGELTYGGDSPGFPNDPVTYAAFVLGGHRIVAWGRVVHRGKQYQEPDDFMVPFDVPGEQAFEDVVLGAVRGI
jgi:hypothetical protein